MGENNESKPKTFNEVDAIYRAHTSYANLLRFGLSGVAILLVVGSWLGINNLNDAVKDAQKNINRSKDSLVLALDKQLQIVRDEVIVKIEDEFERKNIRELIEEVAKYKVQQYGDKRITEMVDSILAPKIELTNLDLLKLAAQNDSRHSLDQLRKLSSQYSYPYRKDAKTYFDEVINEYNNQIYPSYLQLNSEDEIDLYKMNIEELFKLNDSVGKVSRQVIIDHVKRLKDMASKTKQEFFISKLGAEKSIEVSMRLSSILIQELKLSFKPTEWEKVLNYGKN